MKTQTHEASQGSSIAQSTKQRVREFLEKAVILAVLACLITPLGAGASTAEIELCKDKHRTVALLTNRSGDDVTGLRIEFQGDLELDSCVGVGCDMQVVANADGILELSGFCVPNGTLCLEWLSDDVTLIRAAWLVGHTEVWQIDLNRPIARFVVLGDKIVGESVRLEALGSKDSSGGKALHHEWKWDDGVAAEGYSTSRTFTTPGTYRITLVVTDTEGHQDSHTAVCRVREQEPIEEAEQGLNSDLVLVYRSNEGGVWNLYLSSLDGTHVVKLTENSDPTFEYLYPKWSPDGTKIAYTTNPSSKYVSQIWIYDLETGQHTEIFDRGGRIAWLDNDTLLIARRNYEDGATLGSSSYLHSLDIDGTNYQDFYYEPGIEIRSPDTSPNGLYVAGKIQPTCNGYSSEIIVMSNVGTYAVEITNSSTGSSNEIGNNRGCAFLNNEEVLVTRGNAVGLRDLLLMNTDGTNVRVISGLFPESLKIGYVPAVSHDGTTVALDGRMDNGAQLPDLYITDPDGQVLVNITNTPDVTENYVDLK